MAQGNYLFYAWAYNDNAGNNPGVLYYGVSGTEVTITESETISVTIPTVAIADAEIALRSIGPAGGWIFYNAGSVQDWGRYPEAAPTEWASKEWGKYGTLVLGTRVHIGTGMDNTALIVAKLNEVPADSDRAAQLCDTLTYDVYEDWFLPSRNELYEICWVLHSRRWDEEFLIVEDNPAYGESRVGGFAYEDYWSSSADVLEYNASMQNFNLGDQRSSRKDNSYRVRAIRAF